MNAWQDSWTALKHHPRERVKMILGRLLYPSSTHQWVSFVRSHAVLWSQLPDFPKLLTRIYRPYGFSTLNCQQRVEMMIRHYEVLDQHGLLTLLKQSAVKPLLIGSVQTKSTDTAKLYLQSLRDGHREGEMSLQLYLGDRFLYSLTFSLIGEPSTPDMVVTRLQSNKVDGAKDLLRTATKSFHGYRPSMLLVQAARQFAHLCACQRVLLVSNPQRVALNPVRRLKIKTDLEGLWRDLGATPQADGFFALSPIVSLPQDFSDVASNKRAEAKRKAALASDLLQALSANMISRD
ncbi:DUF535 family protein [Limnohabitans planktonicus]|uniref:DUF535 domain-containing protein n=1 Tax=Limnohabitans planktonicus II-D5 TaxID=1293045 RepID=A0A2T7UIX0_9BURK|nr:DUF535 family protein [Limnohabitans planktonicus]PVE44612.1 hypothetical protein H663_000915 [Limnohabitans planktonicus II-D5]|eukprot:gene22170-28279_t